jgi:hypothetical protein
MSDELVTIEKFYNEFEAGLAKLELDNNGIHSVIVGGDVNAMLPYVEDFGVELKVMEKDVEKAKAILESQNKDPEGDA